MTTQVGKIGLDLQGLFQFADGGLQFPLVLVGNAHAPVGGDVLRIHFQNPAEIVLGLPGLLALQINLAEQLVRSQVLGIVLQDMPADRFGLLIVALGHGVAGPIVATLQTDHRHRIFPPGEKAHSSGNGLPSAGRPSI